MWECKILIFLHCILLLQSMCNDGTVNGINMPKNIRNVRAAMHRARMNQYSRSQLRSRTNVRKRVTENSDSNVKNLNQAKDENILPPKVHNHAGYDTHGTSASSSAPADVYPAINVKVVDSVILKDEPPHTFHEQQFPKGKCINEVLSDRDGDSEKNVIVSETSSEAAPAQSEMKKLDSEVAVKPPRGSDALEEVRQEDVEPVSGDPATSSSDLDTNSTVVVKSELSEQTSVIDEVTKESAEEATPNVSEDGKLVQPTPEAPTSKDTEPTPPPSSAEVDSEEKSIKEEKPDDDDLQSFEEWKKNQIQSQEVAAAVESHASPQRTIRTKKTQMNYASQDCGAKVLSHSPGAKLVGAILDENKDLYMLNPCSDDIWFVVELCEPIQVQQFQLANLELFSSMPHLFDLYTSERYPAREWHNLGTFEARNERAIQTFLSKRDEVMFAKYLKFEMKSHFGNEHFCPLTLIRVFGVSMVEEYESHEEEKTSNPEDPSKENGQAESKKQNSTTQNAAEVAGEAEDSKNEEEPGSIGKVLTMVKHAVDNLLGNGKTEQDVNSTSSRNNETTQLPTTPENLTHDEANETVWESPITLVTNKSELELSFNSSSIRPIVTLIETGDGQELSIDSTVPPLYPLHFLQHISSKNLGTKLCWFLEFMYRVSLLSCVVPNGNRTVASSAFFLLPITRNHSSSSKRTSSKDVEEDTKRNNVENAHEKPNFVLVQGAHSKVSGSKPEGDGAEAISFPVIEQSQPLKETPNSTKLNKQNGTVSTGTSERKEAPEVVERSTKAEVAADKAQSSTSGENQTFLDEIKKAIADDGKKAVCDRRESTPKPDEEANSTEDRNPIEQSSSREKSNSSESDTAAVNGTDTAAVASNQPRITENDSADGSVATQASPVEQNQSSLPEDYDTTTLPPTPSPPTTTSPPSVNDPSTNGRDVTTPIPSSSEQKESASEDTVVINPATKQKESVLMRLSNRIRTLEQNLSLSSAYLENLSRRYKRQMDEMQKAFNQTQNRLKEMQVLVDDNDAKHSELLMIEKEKSERLRLKLEDMDETTEQLNRYMIARHFCLMAIESFILIVIGVTCFGVRQMRMLRKMEIAERRVERLLALDGRTIANGDVHSNSTHSLKKSESDRSSDRRSFSDDIMVVNKSTVDLEQLTSLFASSSNSTVSNPSRQRKKSIKSFPSSPLKKRQHAVKNGKILKASSKLTNGSLASPGSACKWTADFGKENKRAKIHNSNRQAKREDVTKSNRCSYANGKGCFTSQAKCCPANATFWQKCTSFGSLVGKSR